MQQTSSSASLLLAPRFCCAAISHDVALVVATLRCKSRQVCLNACWPSHRMSTDEARELLGLAPTSSFDQAMKARNKRLERYKDDAEMSMQVWRCYQQGC